MTEIISLNGKWRCVTDKERVGERKGCFKPAFDVSTWSHIDVPSNWNVAGLSDYSGIVWHRLDFFLKDIEKGSELYLRFKGVDYFAKVWLNGEYIGNHEGYFQPFEFNITQKVNLSGRNTLIVMVDSAAEDLEHWPHRKRVIKGVFGHHDCRPGSWHPKYGQSLGTGGIWNDVEIVIGSKIKIKNVKIRSELLNNYTRAKIEVEVNLESGFLEKVEIPALISLINLQNQKEEVRETKIKIEPGLNQFIFELNVDRPSLWWTWDFGEANLYILKLKIEKEEETLRFGIRELKIDEKKIWYLNGKRIFIRGTNVIPEEYLSLYSAQRIKKDLELAREANINAIRIHAHVNRTELYDLCDEFGILIWQDFPLQWEYEQSAEFYENAKRQIKDMVNLLYNNPSVAVWCCHNEPIKSKKTLDPLLHEEVKKEDPMRPVFSSSDFEEHPYPGWFYGDYRYFVSLPGSPMPAEFGAQALPNLETLKKMFKEEELWPPQWNAWAYRDLRYEQMFYTAGVQIGNSLEEFIKGSQRYQGKLLKFAIESYRCAKWNNITGLFQFLFADPWPAISYSVLDYYRNPKEGYYILKMAYQPIILIFSPERTTFFKGDRIRGTFHLINDFLMRFPKASIKMSFKKEKIVHSYREIVIDIEANSCKEVTNTIYSQGDNLEIPRNLETGPYLLCLEIFDMEGKILSKNEDIVFIDELPSQIGEYNAVFE